jgi:AAHS family 3-hydroxyphenylpropionic acid transporter
MDTIKNEMRELKTIRIVFFCFLVIMLEGFDIQAAGLAAPRLVPELGLKPAQIGTFFSSAALGSLLFTALGGLLADRFGRKIVIIISTATFGLFCLLTPLSPNFETLVVLRFLTGAGLGASLPPILALVSDHSPRQHKKRWVGVVYSAISIGGMLSAGILAARLVSEWRSVFYIGGVLPLIVAVAMIFGLPSSKPRAVASETGIKSGWADILGSGRTTITLALWLVTFLTLSALYLLVSWLPSIMTAKGLTPQDAFTVQMAFNLGSTIAALTVGYALDRKHIFSVPAIGYLMLAASFAYFSAMPLDVVIGSLVSFCLGAGVTAGQTYIYGFAPLAYPLHVRASGVGYALTAGRIGTIAGPLGAGLLLAMGYNVAQILMFLVPLALSALVVAIWLSWQMRAPAAA